MKSCTVPSHFEKETLSVGRVKFSPPVFPLLCISQRLSNSCTVIVMLYFMWKNPHRRANICSLKIYLLDYILMYVTKVKSLNQSHFFRDVPQEK